MSCDSRPIEVPTPRGEHDGVWDEARERFVFFGGDEGTPVDCFPQTDFVNDTWVWEADCGNFRALDLEEAPKRRGRFATALDSARERMLIHGGRTRKGTTGAYTLFDDTWAFDLAADTWTKLDSGATERANHIAVVAGDRLLVYGGNASTDGASFVPLGDLWALDLEGGGWTELTPANEGPGSRLFHAGAVSTDGKTMYVYGGGDENAFTGPFFRDLWALDVDTLTWTLLHDGVQDAPIGRIWASLFFDGNRLLLWAGHDDGVLGNSNELWAFHLDTSSWELLVAGDQPGSPGAAFCDFPADFTEPDLASPERRNADASALRPDGSIVTFGGKTDCGLINDLWTWSEGTWTQESRATAGESCTRAYQECESLCF